MEGVEWVDFHLFIEKGVFRVCMGAETHNCHPSLPELLPTCKSWAARVPAMCKGARKYFLKSEKPPKIKHFTGIWTL